MTTPFELDDFKQTWKALERRLDTQQSQQRLLFRRQGAGRLRSALFPLILGQSVQIFAGVLLMWWFAPFWIAHRDTLHLLLYGVSLHAYGLMFVVFGARCLYLVSRLDYSAPVLSIQKELAQLRAWQVKTALGFGLAGCFIWIPLMLTLFYWLGADVWVHNPQVVGWFFLSSLVPVLVLFAVIGYSRRPGRERFRAALERNAVGGSVHRVQSLVDELAQFERE